MTKDELRKLIKTKRKDFFDAKNLAEISDKIVDIIAKSDFFINSSDIALYYPLKYEIDLRKLLDFKDKNFYFPKCVNNDLEFAKYNGNFKSGCFNILEPVSDAINPEILDIIFIPCLCCNKYCYRLGYGKGFYDRFFSSNNIKAKKIIVSAHRFITNEFIQDDFDYRCDAIICENGIFK